MSNFELTDFNIKDGIGLLKITREKAFNALNEAVIDELGRRLDELSGLEDLRGLVITGEGEKAFIAGADIKAMQGMDAKSARDFSKKGQALSLKIEEFGVPIIAAVNGFALGGGLEMALACDFIYATKNAQFGLPEVSLGLLPGFGGTQRLAKVIGRNKAKELIYTGRKVKIEEAMELGLVLKSFDSKEQMLMGCWDLLKSMQANSPHAIKVAKKVINAGVDFKNIDGLKLEADAFGEIFKSEDMQEGVAAFVEKRKPDFKGR